MFDPTSASKSPLPVQQTQLAFLSASNETLSVHTIEQSGRANGGRAAVFVAVAVAVDMADAVAVVVGRGVGVTMAFTVAVAVTRRLVIAVAVAVSIATGEPLAVIMAFRLVGGKFRSLLRLLRMALYDESSHVVPKMQWPCHGACTTKRPASSRSAATTQNCRPS